jgi:RNA polymerase-binding transcription factor DksA
MKHIPQETLAKLKQTLLDQKSKLDGVKTGVDEQNPVNDTDRLTDHASADADATEDVSILSSEVLTTEVSDSLTRVDAALKRMEAGTYGLTESGQEIPVDRLLADPTATTLMEK